MASRVESVHEVGGVDFFQGSSLGVANPSSCAEFGI